MTTALGLLGIVAFIVCVIAVAAGITWLVVRVTPSSPRRTPSSDSS